MNTKLSACLSSCPHEYPLTSRENHRHLVYFWNFMHSMQCTTHPRRSSEARVSCCVPVTQGGWQRRHSVTSRGSCSRSESGL